eukprot:TRINITY_DN8486_c0_g1_i1.p1 TRINITY_DN8486_c0_g1~~TRINITY_DN8486_c0_g1_i1.p1  ORF type:complete len:116 (+),score=5.89 TRINITY_DN8486_c0_g1_i1:115-462(+)
MVLVRNLNTKCASATLESPGFEGNASDFKKRLEVLKFPSANPQFPWWLVGERGLSLFAPGVWATRAAVPSLRRLYRNLALGCKLKVAISQSPASPHLLQHGHCQNLKFQVTLTLQ